MHIIGFRTKFAKSRRKEKFPKPMASIATAVCLHFAFSHAVTEPLDSAHCSMALWIAQTQMNKRYITYLFPICPVKNVKLKTNFFVILP